MISKILLALAAFVKAVISSLGYPGIALLMGIESACIPLPSEVIMPFAGFLVYTGRFSSLWLVATIATHFSGTFFQWIAPTLQEPLRSEWSAHPPARDS